MKLVLNNKIISVIEYKSFFKKAKGLMFKKELINYGIRLNNCGSIHTFFMKQDIDVCITDKNNRIIYLEQRVKNNRVISKRNGYYTYELPLNSINNLKIGTKLKIDKN